MERYHDDCIGPRAIRYGWSVGRLRQAAERSPSLRESRIYAALMGQARRVGICR
jgi:hypothetical protein